MNMKLVKAIKSLAGVSNKEAKSLAKSSKPVRVKKKKLILQGKKNQTLASIGMENDTMTVILPEGSKVVQDNNTVTINFLPKKKKKAKEQENGMA